MLKEFFKKFKTDPLSEPLVLQKEIGHALIADLTAIGDGEYVLPSDQLLVSILASNNQQKDIIKAAFGNGKLEKFASQKLAEEKCSQTVSTTLKFITKQKKHWTPGQVFEITYNNDRSSSRVPTVTIKILNGKAEKEQYELKKEVINFGRGTEVVDKYGTLIRKNDIVFEDIADSANTYVSKIHAQIKYNAAENTFYLSDSGFEFGLVTNGTRLFRQSTLIAKLNADQKVPLQNGDEIHLGKAAVRFELSA